MCMELCYVRTSLWSSMSSPIAIFITKCATRIDNNHYDYSMSDMVFGDGIGFAYSGQKKGIEDFKLVEAVENGQTFFVYFRHKKTIPFMFMGKTKNAAIPDVEHMTVLLNGDNMYPTQIKTHPGMTNKQNALIDFMERNGVHGIMPTKINLMKGFYLLNEIVNPKTFKSAPIDISMAYNWPVATM